MHSAVVLVQCLRVVGLEREWWLDLPELTSIQFGDSAFWFKDDDSSELIMRSGDDEMNWWIDLPKLTTLTTEVDYSYTFYQPRIITLEGTSIHSTLTNRHALSHNCYSGQDICFPKEENRSHEESLSFLSLIPRHHSRSPTVPLLSSFFHKPLIMPFLCTISINTNSPFSLHSIRNSFHTFHNHSIPCFDSVHTPSTLHSPIPLPYAWLPSSNSSYSPIQSILSGITKDCHWKGDPSHYIHSYQNKHNTLMKNS